MKRTFLVLVVDDDCGDYSGRLSASILGRRPDWRFLFARTEREADVLLKKNPVDAVVLDTDLGAQGGEGVVFIRHIKERFPDLPVIFLTASHDRHVLRGSFISSVPREDLRVQDLLPEGLLFKDEVFGHGRFELLEREIARGLERYGRVDNRTGVLITHGTDTLSWALAYLRYSLKGLRSNVAVTGSQIPLEGTFSPSDAIGNLRTAVYLLSRLKPAHLFAVFNNGKQVFSGRLIKFRKWDPEAFEGRLAAEVNHDGIKLLRDDWTLIPYEDQRLEELYLLRTGGTIESTKVRGGSFAPKGDFVSTYVSGTLGTHFERLVKHEIFALDSSNVSYEEWKMIALRMEKLGLCRSDTRFDAGVKPVFANPLFTSSDYGELFSMCGKGAVLLGYGAGNANTMERSKRSVLPALKRAVKEGKTVAVTSQVPLEPYDAEYESGRKLLENGGIPCGDLSFADAQVKLSYILGHAGVLESAARESGLDEELLKVASFLSGVTLFRSQCEELQKRFTAEGRGCVRLLPYDPFVANSFEKGLSAVVKVLKQI